MVLPLHLSANQPADRFYRGGESIRHFRTEAASPAAGDRVPEDWVGSVTTLFGESELGQTVLPSGERLASAIAKNAEAWLGAEHVRAYGADPMLLVKLLDAGQRLPVHVHPSNEFAEKHLHAPHGKAEAWYILTGGVIHLGFIRDVSPDELAQWVELQEVETMLATMHRIEVAPGDSVYVPPGMPHAIGGGIFLVEVQQPADLSILVEWKDFAIDGPVNGHLGLGFPLALSATDLAGWTTPRIEGLVVRTGLGGETLATAAGEHFRAERHNVSGEVRLEQGFSIIIVLEGSGEMTLGEKAVTLSRGDTVLVAHDSGDLTVRGALAIMRCRPPQAR